MQLVPDFDTEKMPFLVTVSKNEMNLLNLKDSAVSKLVETNQTDQEFNEQKIPFFIQDESAETMIFCQQSKTNNTVSYKLYGFRLDNEFWSLLRETGLIPQPTIEDHTRMKVETKQRARLML